MIEQYHEEFKHCSIEDTARILCVYFQKNDFKFSGVIFLFLRVKTFHNVEYSYWLTILAHAGMTSQLLQLICFFFRISIIY